MNTNYSLLRTSTLTKLQRRKTLASRTCQTQILARRQDPTRIVMQMTDDSYFNNEFETLKCAFPLSLWFQKKNSKSFDDTQQSADPQLCLETKLPNHTQTMPLKSLSSSLWCVWGGVETMVSDPFFEK